MRQRPGLIGTILNDTYRIERLIGEGGMGAVFEATHLRAQRRFAVKVLATRWGRLSDEESVTRFRREVEVTRRLGHPHIVEVTDARQSADGLLYFVMELLRGEDLGALLKRERTIAPLRAAIILEQVASALEVAHQKGIVHRDLKPSNIFLCDPADSDDPQVKVMDFSLSKVLGAARGPTDEAMVLGTPWFMAPEQAEGRSASVTPQTDIYAAGAILYRAITGRPPFSNPGLDDLLNAIVARQPVAPRRVAPRLSADGEVVILKALSKRPEDRYGSMGELSEAFMTAVAGDPFADAATRKWRSEWAVDDDATTPPAERIDDLETPPLERVVADEGARADGAPQEESLPSVLIPEVDNAETVPGIDLAELRPTKQVRLPRSDELEIESAAEVEIEPADDGELLDPTAEMGPPPAPRRRSWGSLVLIGILGLGAGGGALLYWSRAPLGLDVPDAGFDVAALHATLAIDVGVDQAPVTDQALADQALADQATATATPRPARHRVLWLSSRPPGAKVFVGARLLGRTPLRGIVVPASTVELTLKHKGHHNRRIPLGAGARPVRLGTVVLKRITRPREEPPAEPAEPGSLSIVVRSGNQNIPANIFLDGRNIGQSPLHHPKVKSGTHRIEARHPDFKSVFRRVEVSAGKESRVVLELRE